MEFRKLRGQLNWKIERVNVNNLSNRLLFRLCANSGSRRYLITENDMRYWLKARLEAEFEKKR